MLHCPAGVSVFAGLGGVPPMGSMGLMGRNRGSLGDRALPFRAEIPYDWIREATEVVFEGHERPDLPE